MSNVEIDAGLTGLCIVCIAAGFFLGVWLMSFEVREARDQADFFLRRVIDRDHVIMGMICRLRREREKRRKMSEDVRNGDAWKWDQEEEGEGQGRI